MRRLVIAFLLISSMTEVQAGRRRAVRSPGGPIATPVAVADGYSVNGGSTLTVPAPGVLANDTLNGAALISFGPAAGTEQTLLGSTASSANGGSLSLSADGAFTYTPSNGFAGSDSFKYLVRNGGGSATGTVTITVNAVAQLNAVTDAYSTPPDSALFVPAPGVLTNDTLGGGTIASFGPHTGKETAVGASSASVSGGYISLRADGSFSYTPPPPSDDGYGNVRQFIGVDNFSYTLQSGSASSTATVSVTVDSATEEGDFVVTTPGHYYAIEGFPGQNPVLQLKRGSTYTFEIKASSLHPFEILGAPEGSVTNNNITRGIITFRVPMAAQNYQYHCTTHDFGNTIETVP